jgi:YD repeat-containing protein
VTGETDARNNTTNYSYNTMGRVTKVEAPTVSVTSESGIVSNIRPTQLYYYDIAGRKTGALDANLYLTTRTLLAGTGHEGNEALVISEYRPDFSVWSNGYDAFRDQRKLTDGLNRITTQAFDKAGRVTQITRPATSYQVSPGVAATGSLIDSYSYDGLGRKLKAWNNLYGVSDAATADYDALGRVTSARAQGGDLTIMAYSWSAGLATTGVGTFGGWIETTTYANSKFMVSKTDNFGRELEKTDMGGHLFTISYDAAGRMTQRSGSLNGASGGQSYTYFNTGQLSGLSGSYGTASYGYDAGGNRISESATSSIGAQITNATASYDAMGRMTNWTEVGSATTPAAPPNMTPMAISA